MTAALAPAATELPMTEERGRLDVDDLHVRGLFRRYAEQFGMIYVLLVCRSTGARSIAPIQHRYDQCNCHQGKTESVKMIAVHGRVLVAKACFSCSTAVI